MKLSLFWISALALSFSHQVAAYNEPAFAYWASQGGAHHLVGDFNGDRKSDIALTGVSWWNSLPVAFANGNGTFQVTNSLLDNFASWASDPGAATLVGDFNGDGKADIALTGASWWNTLPIAFSNGDGTFRVTDSPLDNFASWAAQPGVVKLVGDFNGDGKADIALIGASWWNTLPVAFSNGDGTFRVTNSPLDNFASWAAQPGVVKLVGDFNGDGKADIALIGGAGWNSLPVAFSNGDGTFLVKNIYIGDFASWATQPGAKALAGDFNGDGRTDIALIGGPDWDTTPIAFSQGDGTFEVIPRIVTQHENNFRIGGRLDETLLTSGNVRSRGMRVKYRTFVEGAVHAQPLYVRAVSFPDGVANALYLITGASLVYAMDAETGVLRWVQQLKDTLSSRNLPRDLPVTPAIDVSNHIIYVLFATKNQPIDTGKTPEDWISVQATLDVAYWLVALDTRTGKELRRAQIQGSTSRSDGSVLSFDPKTELSHPALLLDHGSIYLAFSANAAEGVMEYHGWVFRYDAATFRPQGVFCTTVNQRGASPEGGGIWQGGAGLAADSEGNVYFTVGNAPADLAHASYGDSFVKLAPNGDKLLFAGAVTPDRADEMDHKDLDLGAGGLMVIPGTHLLAGGGKTGTMYLVDGSTMNIRQSFQAFTNTYHPDWTWGCPTPVPNDCQNWSAGPHLHGSPTFWRGPDSVNAYFYAWSEKDYLKQFKFNLLTKRFDENPTVGKFKATETLMPGGLTSLSANENTHGTGILWAVLPCNGPSHVYAFDAETLDPLWDQSFPDAPDSLKNMSHHAAPTIADGKLVLATSTLYPAPSGAIEAGGVIVYELSPPTSSNVPSAEACNLVGAPPAHLLRHGSHLPE